MAKKMITPGHDLLVRVNQAFLDNGYSGLSMVGLARICGFTQRALYYYFSNKEEAFRAAIKHRNEQAIETALAAGHALRESGGTALDILAEVIDHRYGETRRTLALSPHVVELNAEAFRRCRDIMIQSAIDFQARLEQLIDDLNARKLLAVKGKFNASVIAQALADGGRAVSQALPPIPADEFTARYRRACEISLYGCATPSAPE